MVLSAKMVGTTLATMGNLEEKTYQTSVRLRLRLKSSMWADTNDIERNITSSDVEFLEGGDSQKKSDTMMSKKVEDKQESAHAPFDSASHVLTTSDLSGVIHSEDVEMNDVMSVYCCDY